MQHIHSTRSKLDLLPLRGELSNFNRTNSMDSLFTQLIFTVKIALNLTGEPASAILTKGVGGWC